MTHFSLCEQLLHTSDAEQRAALWQSVARSGECVGYFLETAQQQLAAAPSEALLRAELAAELATFNRDDAHAAQAWRCAAQARRAQGDHLRAVTAFTAAAAAASRAGDPRLAARVQIGCVDSLGWLGRHDEAMALGRRLVAELRTLGEETDAARVLVNMGALHYRRDQYRAALSCYESAMEVLARGEDVTATARVKANMASVLTELHRADEAIVLYEQARVAFLSGGAMTAAAMVDANLGFLHYLSGRHSAAVTALSRARQEFAERGQTLEAAKSDADLADAYRELNLYPEAVEAYTRAISELEGLGIDYERGRAELGRASVWMTMERTEESMAGLGRAETLFRAQRNTTQLAHVRLVRAHLLRRQGETPAAVQQAMHAANALQRRGLRGWAAEGRFVVAEIALDANQDAVRAMHAVRRAANANARGWLECRAYRALGRYYLRRGSSRLGLRYLRAGIQALEKARTSILSEELHISFLRDKLSVYEEMIAALLARGRRQDIAEALEYVERAKSRLLLERIEAALEGRIPRDDLSAPLRDRLRRLRGELSRIYNRLNTLDANEVRRKGKPDEAEALTLATLEAEYRTALQQAEAPSDSLQPRAFLLPHVIPTEHLARRLDSAECLLEYYIVDGMVCAWVVTQTAVQCRRNIARIDDILHLTRRLRYQLQRMSSSSELAQRHAGRFLAGIQEVFAELYRLLLRPLEDLLSAEQMVIVPHGALHGLPFHAFFDGSGYFLERKEVVYAPSAALWYDRAGRQQRPQRAGGTDFDPHESLLIGVPSFGIEQVEREVTHLAALLPHSRLLCREAATLEAFSRYAGQCRLLHMATHGLYRADNPLFSGLQLADGWLLARDLYEIPLNCDLATLSACQTGITSVETGDELFGLIRGFLAAGARSVAASLWLADDHATAFLMADFYRRLQEGNSKAAALRAAQRHTQERYPHPYHWAAFALIGQR